MKYRNIMTFKYKYTYQSLYFPTISGGPWTPHCQRPYFFSCGATAWFHLILDCQLAKNKNKDSNKATVFGLHWSCLKLLLNTQSVPWFSVPPNEWTGRADYNLSNKQRCQILWKCEKILEALAKIINLSFDISWSFQTHTYTIHTLIS